MTDRDQPSWMGPPGNSDEPRNLLGFLERQRAILAWKCRGVDATGLQVRLGPSAVTLGGLLKHLARAEDLWFSIWLHGNSAQAPWDRETDWEWDWHSAARDDPEDLWALWQHTTDRCRSLVAESLAAGGLDQPSAPPWNEENPPSLRWILTHMIEEYARHIGHADLIRESVDGLVGEEPAD